MAPRVQLRENRQQVRSYREQSFDDDDDDENFVAPDDLDVDDLDLPSSPELPPQRKSPRERPSTRQRGKAKVSYNEQSDDERIPPSATRTHQPASRKRKRGNDLQTSIRPKVKGPNPRKKRKLREIGAPLRRSHKDVTSTRMSTISTLKTDGKIPQWTSLPYAILYQIFFYASRAPQQQYRSDPASASWLLGVAKLNKAFAEPSLAALYYCPPLYNGAQAFKFLDMISSPEAEKHYLNYNVKIKMLEIAMEHGPLRSTPGRGVFDPTTLIPYTPQLQSFNYWSRSDLPANRSLSAKSRMYIGSEIFQLFEQYKISLISWHWRGNIADATTASFHKTASMIAKSFDFKHPKLESATFSDFNAGFLAISDNSNPNVAKLCCELPSLRKLTLQKCAINDSFLSALPKALSRLTMVDCDSLTSAMLGTFLKSHGNSLTELVLNHNRNMSLSFLVDLKAACPKLEVLSINLTYYSTLQSTEEVDIGYDHLLSDDELPTWPSTLQFLELIQLRKWSGTAAENFFESIVESAPSLPDLRKLILAASVNEMSWKQRAAFRDAWETKLKRIFLRTSSPPNPNLMSLKAFRLWKHRSQPMVVVDTPERPVATAEACESSTGRRRRESEDEEELPPSQPNAGPGSSRRVRSKRKATDSSEDSDAPQALSSLRNRVMNVLEDHIQGMCDVVDIRIDNLRPRENMFTEREFLDSEKSGDEDYVEGQEEFEPNERYAW